MNTHVSEEDVTSPPILATAAKNVDNALRHYEEATDPVARELSVLKLQACIFQFDISSEMVSYLNNKAQGVSGFVESLALKGLVLRLFEYEQVIETVFIPRIRDAAADSGHPIGDDVIKAERAKFMPAKRKLHGLKTFRDACAGHYGKDLDGQVAAAKALSPDEVMSVAKEVLLFNMQLLMMLSAIIKRGPRRQVR